MRHLFEELIFGHCSQISKNILRLCLWEVFIFNFMQTDPNWSNFLFNSDNGKASAYFYVVQSVISLYFIFSFCCQVTSHMRFLFIWQS